MKVVSRLPNLPNSRRLQQVVRRRWHRGLCVSCFGILGIAGTAYLHWWVALGVFGLLTLLGVREALFFSFALDTLTRVIAVVEAAEPEEPRA